MTASPEQPPPVPDGPGPGAPQPGAPPPGAPPAGGPQAGRPPPGMPQPWGQAGAPMLPPWSGGGPAPEPPKQSSRPIWGGVLIVLGICALGLSGMVVQSGPWGVVASLFAGLATLFPVVAIVLLFPEKTRRWALGMLLGYGLALVIAFVGCIGLIVAYSQSAST